MSRPSPAGPRAGGSARPGATAGETVRRSGPGEPSGERGAMAETASASDPDASADRTIRLHGTCVAVAGHGLLLRGPSGVGKSRLALHMMALGARLVADDMVEIVRQEAWQEVRLIVRCPPAGRGLIEARGLGLLNADPAGPVPLAHVVDLDAEPGPRLPPRHTVTLLRHRVPLHRVAPGIESAGALMQLMRAGRHA